MTAAVRIELDAEQLDELAERIAAKLRAPRPRAKPPMTRRQPTDADRTKLAKMLRRKGLV